MDPRSAGSSMPIPTNASWDVFGSHFVFFKKRWEFPCYFWIIRVVNSQLALYSHVRYNPLDTPETPSKHPQMTITNFNYECSYLPGLICNIVIKADLGRSTPTPKIHHGIYIMECIWQPFWILQEKAGISFYVWIISPSTPPKHPHMTIATFNYEGSYLPGVICNIVVKADLGRWTPQWIENRCLEYHYTKLGRWIHFGWWTPQWIKNRCLEYCYTKLGKQTHFDWWTLDLLAVLPTPHKCIMECIWQPFCILQEKVGISCYFWIIRVVNSQLALYSHVRCNPLDTPETPSKHPQMTITNFNYECSYLPGLICNIVIKADLGRSTPTPQMHHGIYIMGCIWQPFWILQEKAGISFYVWIISPSTPPHDNCQLSTMRTLICQV